MPSLVRTSLRGSVLKTPYPPVNVHNTHKLTNKKIKSVVVISKIGLVGFIENIRTTLYYQNNERCED